jgi:hypothetical protein
LTAAGGKTRFQRRHRGSTEESIINQRSVLSEEDWKEIVQMMENYTCALLAQCFGTWMEL